MPAIVLGTQGISNRTMYMRGLAVSGRPLRTLIAFEGSRRNLSSIDGTV